MKQVKVLHNPNAGHKQYSKKKLVSEIKAGGFECRYSSTKKKGWDTIDPEIDFLAIAGGDGTVRKVTEKLLEGELSKKNYPIGLLPVGTANNIAKTLYIGGRHQDIIQNWHNMSIKKFDVGKISGAKGKNFFLESFGYGIFPYLMQEMMDKNDLFNTPEKRMGLAVKLLDKILLSYKPRYCKMKVDGTDHSGEFLLIEIMNTRSIGPNLGLAPHADPGDGELDVVLIPKTHRDKFTTFIHNKMKGMDDVYSFHTLKAKNISIRWGGTHVHLDDEIVHLKKEKEINIELKEGLLRFLV